MKRAKTIFYVLMSALIFPFTSFSQEQTSSFSSLLSKYFDIKNALVASDAAGAVKAAGDFMALTKIIDTKVLSTNEQRAFKSVQLKLLADGNGITVTKDLAKQRAIFQNLSVSIITLTKSCTVVKPAYITYLPDGEESLLDKFGKGN